MRIRTIYKAGKEFKEYHFNLKHAFEDDEHFKNLKISREERNREIEDYNKSKQIYLLDDLYVAIIDENSPDLKYQKDDLVLFSNSLDIEKHCLVVCKYKDRFLLARYLEAEDSELIFTLKPLSEDFPELSEQNSNDLEIFGMVLHLERMSKDWQEQFKEDNEEAHT